MGRWPGGKHVWWWIVRKGLNIEIKTYMIFMQNKQTDRQCSLPNLYQGYNILWCWGKEVNVIFTTFQQIDLHTLFVHSFIHFVSWLLGQKVIWWGTQLVSQCSSCVLSFFMTHGLRLWKVSLLLENPWWRTQHKWAVMGVQA